MVGSGTTLDACAYLGRKGYGYDVQPLPERADIVAHDLNQGWPERTAQAQLIFWDPPYYKKKEEEYGPHSISRLPRSEYLAFFERAARNLPTKFNGRIAFLCSDYVDESNLSESIFVDDYVRLFIATGWCVERRIQAPLSTQQVHPDFVKRFRESRRLAHLARDLVVLKRV
jgi:DNA modification methylase